MSRNPTDKPAASALAIQLRVWNALILREIEVRFGKDNIGYFWAVVEPLTIVLILSAIRLFLGRSAPDGMHIVPFMTTGFLPYMAFRSTNQLVMSATGANRRLLMHPQLIPLDFMIARTVLQVPTVIVIFALAHVAMLVLGFSNGISQPLGVALALLMAVAIGAGLGSVFYALTDTFPFFNHVVGPLMRPMFFISGIFFVAKEIPEPARSYLLWNPVLHITELSRSAYFSSFNSEYYSYTYIFTWILSLLFLGLLLERIIRSRLSPT